MHGEAIDGRRLAAENDDLAQGLQFDVGQAAVEVGVDDAEPGFRETERMFEQAAPIGEVERHEHRTELIEAEPDAQAVRGVGQPDEDAVALADSESPERVRRAPGDVEGLRVGPLAAVGEHGEDLVRLCGRPALEHQALDALLRLRHAGVDAVCHHSLL